MKIKGLYNVTNTEIEDFIKEVSRITKELQDDKQEVEIQYSNCISKTNDLVFSALIIGRI